MQNKVYFRIIIVLFSIVLVFGLISFISIIENKQIAEFIVGLFFLIIPPISGIILTIKEQRKKG